jgi:hypothetical protein
MYLYSVRGVNFPNLEMIDGDLNVGAFSSLSHPLSNHSFTVLEEFSAPKLSKIGGTVNVGNSSRLAHLSFPTLRTVDGDVRINCFPAVNLEKGVEMLKLKRVHNVQVIGSAPSYKDWDARRRRGVVQSMSFWCGVKEKWKAEEMVHKLWTDRKVGNKFRRIEDCSPYELKPRFCAEGFGVEDCHPGSPYWCSGSEGWNLQGWGKVICSLTILFFVVWWVKMRSRVRRNVQNEKRL